MYYLLLCSQFNQNDQQVLESHITRPGYNDLPTKRRENQAMCDDDTKEIVEARDREKSLSILASVASSSSSPTDSSGTDQNAHRSLPIRRFQPKRAERIIETVLEDALCGMAYDYDIFSELTVQLSTRIKDRIKSEMYLPRYKLVASVTIAQLSNLQRGIGIGTCSRPLWNDDTDNYAEAYYATPTLYASGVVYAAYYE